MRHSSDEFDANGVLVNGFDYDLQVWVVDGIVQPCGHPAWMQRCCNAKRLAGMAIKTAREESTC